jgi:hypothetical protein
MADIDFNSPPPSPLPDASRRGLTSPSQQRGEGFREGLIYKNIQNIAKCRLWKEYESPTT